MWQFPPPSASLCISFSALVGVSTPRNRLSREFERLLERREEIPLVWAQSAIHAAWDPAQNFGRRHRFSVIVCATGGMEAYLC